MRYFNPQPRIAVDLPPTDTDRQISRDLLLLLNFSVDQTTSVMIGQLLSNAPPDVKVPFKYSSSLNKTHDVAEAYVKNVRGTLGQTMRALDFSSVMHEAETQAELEIERIPPEQRPQGIDPLQLRRWAISNLQCARAVVFLRHEKMEMDEKLISQRESLIERLMMRNNS